MPLVPGHQWTAFQRVWANQLRPCRPCCTVRAKQPQKGGEEQSPGDSAGGRNLNPSPITQPILDVPGTSKPPLPKERSSYRRRALQGEALKQSKAAQRREDETRMETLARMAHAIRTEKPKVGAQPSIMFVDALNILHRDEHLMSMMSMESRMGRAELEKWVEAYARRAKIRCRLVWDAMGGPSHQVRDETPPPHMWTRSVYSTACEADSWIIRQAERACKQGAYRVIVVSGDNRIREELPDKDSIFMIDPDQFMQHLREVQAGNTSGPDAWRTLWRLPQLTPVRKPTASSSAQAQQRIAHTRVRAQPGSSSSSSSGSDSDDLSEGEGGVQPLVESEDLASTLESIVRQLPDVPYSGSGAAYMQVLQASAGAESTESKGERNGCDQEEAEFDLDELLGGARKRRKPKRTSG